MLKLSADGKWYRVSLRFIGDGVPVDEIESKLRLTPEYVGKKGERYQNSPLRGKYHTNLWTWSYPGESDVPFEEQITGLLEVIEPKKAILKEILSLPAVEGELFLGFGSENGQNGALLSHELLSRIVECGLSLDLDVY